MGFFKQMKDMKNAVETAPEMVRSARALGAQAQEMAAAQQAAAASAMASFNSTATAGATPGSAASRDPISGVSLALYAEVSKGLAAYNYDQSKAVGIAASKGVAAQDWETAAEGWNARIKQDRSLAKEFNQLYTGR